MTSYFVHNILNYKCKPGKTKNQRFIGKDVNSFQLRNNIAHHLCIFSSDNAKIYIPTYRLGFGGQGCILDTHPMMMSSDHLNQAVLELKRIRVLREREAKLEEREKKLN
jgi:hypothetical protein